MTSQLGENILAVRLDALGDVIMTSAAFATIKANYPRGRLTLLTSPAGAMAARFIPSVDDVIVVKAPWMKHDDPVSSEGLRELADRLRERAFDAAFIFTVYSQNPLPAAMLCHLAGIPMRAAHCRENPYALLTHWVKEREPHKALRHEVKRHLDFLAEVGLKAVRDRLDFAIGRDARARVRVRLEEEGVTSETPFVVIHPGATASSRRYPIASFARAAALVHETMGWPLVVTGSVEERELAFAIVEQVPSARAWAGTLDFESFAATIGEARLIISNNTSAVHIASALQTPVVDLYALTNPQHEPWNVPHRTLSHQVPCAYCYKSICPRGDNLCLSAIKPHQVCDAAVALIADTTPREESA